MCFFSFGHVNSMKYQSDGDGQERGIFKHKKEQKIWTGTQKCEKTKEGINPTYTHGNSKLQCKCKVYILKMYFYINNKIRFPILVPRKEACFLFDMLCDVSCTKEF